MIPFNILLLVLKDQMEQFSKLYTSTLDKRLAKMESKINQIDLELKDLKEKGKIWESFR
jgi:hypothetical protein